MKQPFVSARVRRLSSFFGSLLFMSLAFNAAAGPEGGVIRRGEGDIVRPNARTTNVHQYTRRMVVDWQRFNVAANEQVNFLQPDSSAAVLNRIFDQDPSRIFGQINANGRVLLANANGILFGNSASVNVGSLIASGLHVDAGAFMNGALSLHADHPGVVVNRGLIHAADGGYVGLIGGAVENSGVIIANYGSIELAAGRTATVDFDGDGLIRFAVSEEVLENVAALASSVNNTGTLRADGGVVAMSGHAANEIFSQVVNNDGVIAARGISSDGGRVFLSGPGGDVVNAGVIDVSSGNARGGYVEISGERVGLFGDAVIDASGATGGEVLVGGDYQGKGDVTTAEMTVMGPDAVIDASASDGTGGRVILWADGYTRFNGTIDATGSTGGFVETSGKESLDVNGTVLAREWLLDPRNVTIGNATTSGGSFDAGNPDTFTPNANDAIVDVNTIIASLNNGTSVIITTADATGGQAGNITVDAAINVTTNALATLTLLADGSIFINQAIADNGAGLNVTLNAGVNVVIDAAINTNGGDVTLALDGNADIQSAIDAGSGDINISAGGTPGIVLDSSGLVNLTAASVTLNATAGSIQDTPGGVANIDTPTLIMAAATDIDDLDTQNVAALTITAGGSVGIDNAGGGLNSLSLTLAPSAGDTYTFDNFAGLAVSLSNSTGNLGIGEIGNGGNALDLSLATTAGNILLDNNAISNIAGGGVSLTAAGAIADNDIDDTAANVTTTGAVTLLAQGGAIGATNEIDIAGSSSLTANANGVLDIAHDSGVATTAALTANGSLTYAHTGAGALTLQDAMANGGGMIDIDSASGIVIGADAVSATNTVDIDATGTGSGISVAANAIGATGALVSLNASGGIDGTGTAGSTEIAAASLALSAGGGVTDLDTAIDNLAVSATGNVTVTEADALHVTTVDGIDGVSGSQVSLAAGGDLTANQAIVSTGDINLALTASGDIGSDPAPVRVNAGGALSVNATGDAWLENAGAGTLTLAAVTGVTGAQTLRLVSTSGLTLSGALIHASLGDDTLILNAGTGTLNTNGFAVGTGNLALSLIGDTLSLGGSSIVAGGGLTVAPGTANATIRLGEATTGTFALDDATIDALLAAGGGTLTIGTSDSGSINVKNVTLGDNQTLNLVTGGDVSGDSGQIAISDAGNAGVTVVLTAGGDISSFRVFATDLAFTAGGSVSLYGDVARIDNSTAGGAIRFLGNGAGTSLTLGNIDTTAGNIEIEGIGAIELDGNIATAGAGDVEFEVLSNVTDVDSNGSITADTLSLLVTSSGSIGAAGAAIRTGVNRLIVTPESDGDDVVNIHINETDAVTLQAIRSTGGLVDIVAGGEITATSVVNDGGVENHDIRLGGAGIRANVIRAANAGDVFLDAGAGGITDVNNAGVLNITADALTLDAEDGIDLDTVVTSLDASVTGTGDLHIVESDAINLADIDTANGLIDIQADGTITATDVFSSADNDANDIALHAITGNITVGNVRAGAGTAGDVMLIADAGAIAHSTTNRLIADDLTLTASVIGTTANRIRTATNTLDASAAGTGGGIFIDEIDAMTLTDVDATDGAIDIQAGGTITAVDVLSSTDSDSNDILLHATAGDIAIDNVRVNGGINGDITLIAGAGAVTQAATNDLVGDVVALTAQNGIGAAGSAIRTNAASLDASVTGTGDLHLVENDGITLSDVDAANGLIDIRAGGAIMAIDVLSVTDSDNNDISLQATAGDIVIGNVRVAGGTAGDIALTAEAGAITDAGNSLVAQDLTLSAATGIGSSANRIDTRVDVVRATVSGIGDIYIADTSIDGIVLGDGAGDIRTFDGDIAILATGDIRIGSITATDNDGSDDTVTLESANASINDAEDDAFTDIAAPNIVLIASNGSVGGNAPPAVDDPAEAIELAGNFSITANGDITIADESNAASTVVSMSSATGDIAFTFDNDIYIDNITATVGDVMLISNAGSIFDQQDDDLTDITVGAGHFVDLRAAGAIGGASEGNATPANAFIELAAGTLLANAGGGNVLLATGGATTLQDISAAAGDIAVMTGGNTEVDLINAGGNVTLNAAGRITDGNGTASSVTGETVMLAASTGIGSPGGAINTTATNLDLTTAGGGVFVDETDGVIIDAISNGGSTIDIGAGGPIQLGADLATTGNTLALDAAVILAGDVTLASSGGDIRVTGDVAGGGNDFMVSSGTGTVSLASATGIGLFRRDGSGAFTVSGDIDAATVDVNSDVQLDAGSDITAMAGGIAISGGLTLAGSGAGTTLNSGADGDIAVGGTITGNRDLLIDAEGDIALGAVSLADHDVRMTVDSDGDAAGTLASAGITAGSVTLSGGGNDESFDIADVNVSGDFAMQTGGTIASGASIAAGGNIRLNGGYAVGDLELTANEIAIAGAIDSTAAGGSIEIENAGTLSLGGDVLLNGTFTQTGAAVTLAGDLQTSADAILIAGELTLGSASHVISSGSGAGNIALNGGVNGNGANLAIRAGDGSIALFGAEAIGGLTLSGNGLVLGSNVSAGVLDLSGMQGALSLATDTAITTDDSDIDFNAFTSIDSGTAASAVLRIDAGTGGIVLDDVTVGASRRLAGIDLEAASISLGDVATSGNQDYAGDLQLSGTLDSASGDVRLDGEVGLEADVRIDAGGNVAVSGGIDGSHSLSIGADGSLLVEGDIGAGSPLNSLDLAGAGIEVGAVTTSGAQRYDGAARVGGDLSGSSLTFGGSLFLPAGAVFTADRIDFNGGSGSVRGNGELSLVPATDGATINLGGNGGGLDLSNTALDGYDAGLVIGGTLSGSSASVVAGTISVNGSLDVGDGYLVLLSRDNVTLHGGELAGDRLTIVAAGENGTIFNEGGTNTVLLGREIILVAGNAIGEDGKDIRARGTRAGARIGIASGVSEVFVDTANTLQELTGIRASIASAIASSLQIRTNDGVQVTSTLQSSANREQGNGLTEEGFIDASLFEEISLYETAGTGIMLPLDQSEEMPAEGCASNETGRVRCGETIGVLPAGKTAMPGAPR